MNLQDKLKQAMENKRPKVIVELLFDKYEEPYYRLEDRSLKECEEYNQICIKYLEYLKNEEVKVK